MSNRGEGCGAARERQQRTLGMTSFAEPLLVQWQPVDAESGRSRLKRRLQLHPGLGIPRDGSRRSPQVRLRRGPWSLATHSDSIVARRNLVKEWESTYERLTQFIVPRSSTCANCLLRSPSLRTLTLLAPQSTRFRRRVRVVRCHHLPTCPRRVLSEVPRAEVSWGRSRRVQRGC